MHRSKLVCRPFLPTRLKFASGAIALILLATVSLIASASQTVAETDPVSGPLDGMVFAGKFGDPGATGRDDKLFFNNGKFWSAICIRCGFEPGDYWVRKVGGSIHFRGEQRSERGTFIYTGKVTGEKIRVDVNWTKNRWYWKIDRDLVFEGTIANSNATLSALEATNVSIKAQSNLPDGCW